MGKEISKDKRKHVPVETIEINKQRTWEIGKNGLYSHKKPKKFLYFVN